MMLRRGREFLRTLLILVIILALYGAYKWGFGSEARYDRAESVTLKRAQSHFPHLYVSKEGFHSRQLRRQQERKELIKNFCKRTGKVGLQAEPIPPRISVNESLKIIYCITPKCASREIRLMLFPGVNGVNTPRLYRQPADKRAMMLETYLKFTFVREPFERILSVYKDKFVHLRRTDRPILEFHGTEILKNFRPNATRQAFTKLDDITFREFIQYLVTKGSNETTPVMDFHWDNYVNFCGLCSINYDFIGHYETMEEDLAGLVAAAGMSAEDAKRFSYKKKASDTSALLLQYYSQIPLEWIDILGWMFRANLEMFGYSFPGPLKSLYKERKHSRAQTASPLS